MEPDHEVGHNVHHEHSVEKLVKQVPKQPLHAKSVADGIEIPAVHDAFVDSHLYGKDHEGGEAHEIYTVDDDDHTEADPSHDDEGDWHVE